MARKRNVGPRKGWTAEALARQERAIGRNPWGGYNHNSIGCEFARVCSWERAVSEFERAVEINPWEAFFKVNLSRAYLGSCDVEKARSMAEAALAQSPKLGSAMFALALAFERLGRGKSAMSWYRKCLDSRPGSGIKHEAEENLAMLLARRS
jgi:tetratricopeptide (TPR) repeat protein